MLKATTFLMFQGRAEEAMNFYTSVFPGGTITSIARFGSENPSMEGKTKRATIEIAGQEFMCVDSPAVHDFTFTPAISVFIRCQAESEVDELFNKLSAGGKVFMPLSKYPFSDRFGWLADQFGVSWQINLEKQPAT